MCERWPSGINLLAEALAGAGFWCWDNPWAQFCISAALQQGQTSGPRKGKESQDKLSVWGLGSSLFCWKSSSIPIWIYLEHDVVPKPMETSIVGHYIVRFSWFFKICWPGELSLSLFLRLCSICERTEEEPALLSRIWVLLAVPGNTCWWPPSPGKLQRVHPASHFLLSHQGV